MGDVLPFRQIRDRPEYKASLMRELSDLDSQIEPLARRAEEIRRYLGLLGVERGVDD